MTWKSYATVSGATVLAGWLASSSPPPVPGSSVPAARAQAAATTGSADIVEQADRLHARVAREVQSPVPERNPFRFADPRPQATTRATAPDGDVAAGPEQLAPVPPPIALAGIAEDEIDGRLVRTAVLSVPGDVLLVREGEAVLGRYRVVRIESEAVELLDLPAGTTERLALP